MAAKFLEPTTGLAYVRLHGDAELYTSGYSDQALDTWAARVGEWRDQGRDVVVYFDNDVKVHAPYDAQRLAARLGLGPRTRTRCVEPITECLYAASS